MNEKEERIPFHIPMKLSDNDIETIKLRIEYCFDEGQISNGVYVKQLEEKIRKMYDADYCVSTSNCTMGLFICYLYYGYLGPLHLQNFTWKSVDIITHKFFKVFHDIDINTWLMSEIPHYGIVSPTHTFGSICEIEKKYDRERIIFDGAHALGTKIEHIGDATVFSLAPTKLITSCEGGMIITNDKGLYEYAVNTRHIISRMSEPNAMIGLATIKNLRTIKIWKKKVFDFYQYNIPGIFQTIPIDSNYNTIGFININNLKIPSWIETKQYYAPIDDSYYPNCEYIFNNIIVLPSFYSCPYKKIVDDILEENKI